MFVIFEFLNEQQPDRDHKQETVHKTGNRKLTRNRETHSHSVPWQTNASYKALERTIKKSQLITNPIKRLFAAGHTPIHPKNPIFFSSF